MGNFKKGERKMKKLTELQRELDEKKYFESMKCNKDLSGGMEYCRKCNNRNKPYFECKLSHEQRAEQSACAKAWNRRNK